MGCIHAHKRRGVPSNRTFSHQQVIKKCLLRPQITLKCEDSSERTVFSQSLLIMYFNWTWKLSLYRSARGEREQQPPLLFSRFDTLARSGLSSPSVRGTSFSGGEVITLLPAISCKFCTPHGSCIEQSRIEPRSSPPPGLRA